jgi:hypothetical protein
MGRCLIATHAFKQNITGGAFEALAAGTGDSLSVPNFAAGSRALLLEAWGGLSANAGEFSVRSPSFHDNTRGLRMAYTFNPTLSGADGDPQLLLPPRIVQPLYASDVLTAEVNGTATNNAALDLLAYYENLPGADQRLESWEVVQARTINVLGIRVSVTAGAAGDYGTARAINADDDRLIANTDYALLGVSSQLPCATLAITAPETSGRKIGLPLHWNELISLDWFVWLSQKYNIPAIPIFNSNNKGNIQLQAADPGGAIATAATLILAELRA